MKDVLAIIGLMILYAAWLSSPLIMCFCAENGYDTVGRIFAFVFTIGIFIGGYVLLKFVGIW